MDNQILLGVYRRLDNRFEGLPEDSPRAVELHQRRQRALHAVLDNVPGLVVVNWGSTDETQPHEYVDVVLAALASPAITGAVIPGLKFVASKLAEKAVDEGASEVVKRAFEWAKWMIPGLRKKQDDKDLLDFDIRLPDGTSIRVDPPDGAASITITFANGAVSSINYVTGVTQDSPGHSSTARTP